MYGQGELFKGLFFHDYEQSRRSSLLEAIHQYDTNAVLQAPQAELENYFIEMFTVQPIEIMSADIYADQPTEENVREQVRDRVWDDEIVTVNRSYISFSVHLPFEGDRTLFDIEPTSRQHSMSQKMNASVVGNEIILRYRVLASDNTNLDSHYSHDVSILTTNAQRLSADINRWNAQIPALVNAKLNEKRASGTKNQTIIQSLKIPIKKRDNVPSTYSIPYVQRKPKIIEAPRVRAYKPEPTLESSEYENILVIIKDMAVAMERSPATFAKLTEEEIRDFFLILLNGHYKGSATGETFNGAGKTDILIRHENANAFIAECKFWKGQKKLSDAIDQLLGYVTWRDTKTSIVLFCKQNDLSSVLEKANETLKKHKNYKAQYSLKSSELNSSHTILGYKFVHPSDPNKEIFLTLLAFQITQPE